MTRTATDKPLTRAQVTAVMLRVIANYERDCRRNGIMSKHSELVQLIYDALKKRGALT